MPLVKQIDHATDQQTRPNQYYNTVAHNLITYMRDRRQYRQRWVTALQQSTLPLALINGSVDPVSGAHMVARYQALQCRLDYLAELPLIGHYPQVEAPDQVIEHYTKYLMAL